MAARAIRVGSLATRVSGLVIVLGVACTTPNPHDLDDSGQDSWQDDTLSQDVAWPDVSAMDSGTADTPVVDTGAPPDDVCSGTVCGGACVNLQTDSSNCGTCGHACSSGQVCSAGACGTTCGSGQTTCGGRCTDTASDVAHCGSCDHVCSVPAHGTARCASGVCVPGCASGWDDCDGDASNGCETDLQSTSAHCGACGMACPARANALATCTSGACVFTCETGYGDCDASPADGCEADLRTSAANCGACGHACSAGMSCSMGTCVSFCSVPGQTQCGSSCVDLTSNVANCGVCGHACPGGANAMPACTGGSCGLACSTGYGNCDGNSVNGCEVDLRTTVASCGSCGHACPSATHATAVCMGSTCSHPCDAGWGDCDGNTTNGCETSLGTTSNCNHCGTVCTALPHMGSPGCSTAGCTSSSTCDSGWGNCDGTTANGCETALNTPSNCHSCGFLCVAGAHATAGCADEGCTVHCDLGWANCDGLLTNGCEADLVNGRATCGTCTTVCSLAQICRAGRCFP